MEITAFDANQASEFAGKWLPAWTGDRPEHLLSFYTADAFYADPALPQGIRGREQLLAYFRKLLGRNPSWVCRMEFRDRHVWLALAWDMAMAQLETLLEHIKALAAAQAGRHRTDCQLVEDFILRSDQSAFVGLVRRHGPMVLRVCQRVLRHEQDAEDAFQATFLVLARRAGSIRKREALASWLYGVAYRTAMQIKRRAGRRRKYEARLRFRAPAFAPGPTWDEVRGILDEELQRLPEPIRAAFVLCVLDAKTVSTAAAELAVKESTVTRRLAQARQRLRQQLVRRGIDLSAVLEYCPLRKAPARLPCLPRWPAPPFVSGSWPQPGNRPPR